MLLSVCVRTGRCCPSLLLYNYSFKSDQVSHGDERKVPGSILIEGKRGLLAKGRLMEQSIIYVVAASGKPLMPTKNQKKVWYWLRKGLAQVERREPLTIRLRFETTEYTQPVTVGVDTGSQTVGIAATSNSEVLYQAEVHLRDDITSKLT